MNNTFTNAVLSWGTVVQSQQNAAKKLGPSTMELRTPKTARPPVCLKKAISSIYGIKLNYLSELPGKCEVSVPYKIDPSIECLQVFRAHGSVFWAVEHYFKIDDFYYCFVIVLQGEGWQVNIYGTQDIVDWD